jgi:hypothetical protein
LWLLQLPQKAQSPPGSAEPMDGLAPITAPAQQINSNKARTPRSAAETCPVVSIFFVSRLWAERFADDRKLQFVETVSRRFCNFLQ